MIIQAVAFYTEAKSKPYGVKISLSFLSRTHGISDNKAFNYLKDFVSNLRKMNTALQKILSKNEDFFVNPFIELFNDLTYEYDELFTRISY